MRVILVIAWICLILSITVNVLSFTDRQLLDSLDGIVMLLHGGIFLVWVPMSFCIQKEHIVTDRKKFWTQVLRNCPGWMRSMIGLFTLYGISSFFLSFLFKIDPRSQWWPFSSMWIVAYSLGVGAIYSYLVSKKAEPPLAKDKD
jgi:hypothetical protein